MPRAIATFLIVATYYLAAGSSSARAEVEIDKPMGVEPAGQARHETRIAQAESKKYAKPADDGKPHNRDPELKKHTKSADDGKPHNFDPEMKKHTRSADDGKPHNRDPELKKHSKSPDDGKPHNLDPEKKTHTKSAFDGNKFKDPAAK